MFSYLWEMDVNNLFYLSIGARLTSHIPRRVMLLLLDSEGGKMTTGPRVKWGGVKGEMKMMWTCGDPRGGGQQRESGLGGKGVKVDLYWRQIAKLWKPSQELSYLEGAIDVHIPWGQIRWLCVQLKRWSTVWSEERQSGQERSSAQLMERR